MARDRPLRLSAIRHVRFAAPPGPPGQPDPADAPDLSVQAEYFAERLAGYGTPAVAERLLPGNRTGYARMARRLLDALPAPPGLVLLAHALPDCDMSVSVGGAIAHALAGEPMVFAVSEQGRATPFTALALAEAHAPDGPPATAVLVLDQGTLFYGDPVLAGLDTATDHAVALLFEDGGPVGFGPAVQHTGVEPERAAALVAGAVRELGPGPVTVTAGPALPPLPSLPAQVAAVRRAPADRLCTSVWSDLAGQLAEPASAGRTILLAEYDPDLRYLSLASCDVPAGWSGRWSPPKEERPA
ncbi:MAG TPA: hypothetical protein VFV01_03640 [Spirillospora sp.]|nr:hypothetical protein [Spirillospora sp.]